MARYNESKIMISTLLPDKKQQVKNYQTTIYRQIPKRDSDIYVITQAGDRLDHLAHQYYGDVNLWWYIAKANNLKFMTIPVGTSLRIPATTQYATGR